MPFTKRTLAINIVLVALTVGIAVPLGKYLANLNENIKSHALVGNYEQFLVGRPYALTLYGTSTCEYCELTRKYLAEAGVPYNDFRIDKRPELDLEFRRLDQRGVPVLLTKNRILTGYHPMEIAELIKFSGTP